MEASQAGGFWLRISAGTFTNEGIMTAESGATLNLGADGATETLTNTGSATDQRSDQYRQQRAIWRSAATLPSPAAAAIAFKGAGADITSDGYGGDIHQRKHDRLEASLSSPGAFSGQIGDQGVMGDQRSDVRQQRHDCRRRIGLHADDQHRRQDRNQRLERRARSRKRRNPRDRFQRQQFWHDRSGHVDVYQGRRTVDLGEDGGTGSMTNTGAVDIYGDSDLAISGNYTVTPQAPAAPYSFKGAGAEITSDGKRVGDVHQCEHDRCVRLRPDRRRGHHGVQDLTFDNSGTVAASGSGVTLTINTGANTSLNAASGTLVAENGATLAILSNLNNQRRRWRRARRHRVRMGRRLGRSTSAKDGGTESMTDTGTVDIWGDSDLAIGGKYTVTGGGTLDLKAPAPKSPATGLRRCSPMQAPSRRSPPARSATRIIASDDLTFDNTGTVLADGSGVTLTLNTGGNTINDGGGKLEAENGATLAIDSKVDTGQASSGSPPGGTIEAGQGARFLSRLRSRTEFRVRPCPVRS